MYQLDPVNVLSYNIFSCQFSYYTNIFTNKVKTSTQVFMVEHCHVVRSPKTIGKCWIGWIQICKLSCNEIVKCIRQWNIVNQWLDKIEWKKNWSTIVQFDSFIVSFHFYKCKIKEKNSNTTRRLLRHVLMYSYPFQLPSYRITT